MKLLLDEMYSPALAEALRAVNVDCRTVRELGLSGRSDADVFAMAVAQGYTILTENVSDFAQISAEHLTAAGHHPGVLIALSTQFSRRAAGVDQIVSPIRAVADRQLEDLVVYLKNDRR